jgi:hypothetical protein
VPADVAAQQDGIPFPHGSRSDDQRMFNHADARRIDIEAIAFPTLHHLRIARDDRHSGGAGRFAHRPDNALKHFKGETFLENEAGAEPARPRSAHRKIVDRAVDGEPPDVATRKKQRTDHVRIRGERESRARRDVENGAVVPRIEGRVGKGRPEDPFDQLLGESPAAAVGNLDLSVACQRHGALKVRRVGDGAGHAQNLELLFQQASHQPGRNLERFKSNCGREHKRTVRNLPA